MVAPSPDTGTSRALDPGGWQPIETASRDGAYLLGYNAIDGVKMYFWRAQGHWGRIGALSTQAEILIQPSHWMPMPKPPQ